MRITLFVSSSLGELDFIIPLVNRCNIESFELETYVVFLRADIYQQVENNTFYKIEVLAFKRKTIEKSLGV